MSKFWPYRVAFVPSTSRRRSNSHSVIRALVLVLAGFASVGCREGTPNDNAAGDSGATSVVSNAMDSANGDADFIDEQYDSENGTVVVESVEASLAGKKTYFADMVDQARAEDPDAWLHGFELTSSRGEKVSSADLSGQPYVASFFYSLCPSVCVRQNDQMALLASRLKGVPIRFLSISCDPENDTPEVLAQYAKRFNANPDRWLFLTGDFEYTRRVSSEVFFHPLIQPRAHIEKFLLVDADGRLIAPYDWKSAAEIDLLVTDAREQAQLASRSDSTRTAKPKNSNPPSP